MMRWLCVLYCYCSNIMRNKPYKFDKLNTIFNLVLQKLSSKQNSLFVHRCIKTTLHWHKAEEALSLTGTADIAPSARFRKGSPKSYFTHVA